MCVANFISYTKKKLVSLALKLINVGISGGESVTARNLSCGTGSSLGRCYPNGCPYFKGIKIQMFFVADCNFFRF